MMAESEASLDMNDPSNQVNQVTEQEKLLALSAQKQFKEGNYSEAFQILGKLQQSRPQDPKVVHNKRVVEFYQKSLVGIQDLRKTLANVAHSLQCNIEETQTLHDVDHCYVFFNEAVSLFHLRQYNSSFKILLQIFTLVEQLDENLAKRVCFLLAEVLLRLEFPQHCLSLLRYMETSLLSRGSKLKSSLEKEKENDKEKETEKESSVSLSVQNKLQKMKLRAAICLRKTAGREKDFENLEREDPAIVSLESHLEYLAGNLNEARKTLNKISQTNSNFAESGENSLAVYYNNLGCVFHSAGKQTLACLNFQKALAANDETLLAFPRQVSGDPMSGRPLFTIGTNYKYEILYNLGVSLLYAGKSADAFDCLIETMQLYHSDPLLWLRLAECCIQVHKPDNSKDFGVTKVSEGLVKEVTGTGVHRKLVLPSRISNQDAECSDNAAIPVPTLDFAALCLRNAEFLLAEMMSEITERRDPTEVKGKPDLNVTLPKSQRLMKIFASNRNGLKASILAASAYVSLCLGDCVSALQFAEQLVTLPDLSGAHKLVGHLYAAESLVLLNRVSEAVRHLQPENVSQWSLVSEGESTQREINRVGPSPGWFPTSLRTGKAVLQYNLSAAFAVRGEYEKSSELLRQLWTTSPSCDIPVQVVTLALYIELRLGRLDAARAIVKQHCPQYRC